ncbi:hypothetical protein ACQKNB_00210 [Lysinibacillus xylanilyticus]|uniref:hypothetical protein n=1 Tax=Lysinibacillus xylanilyticus TaxID=582475 RepID=UPI003CFDF5B6
MATIYNASTNDDEARIEDNGLVQKMMFIDRKNLLANHPLSKKLPKNALKHFNLVSLVVFLTSF